MLRKLCVTILPLCVFSCRGAGLSQSIGIRSGAPRWGKRAPTPMSRCLLLGKGKWIKPARTGSIEQPEFVAPG